MKQRLPAMAAFVSFLTVWCFRIIDDAKTKIKMHACLAVRKVLQLLLNELLGYSLRNRCTHCSAMPTANVNIQRDTTRVPSASLNMSSLFKLVQSLDENKSSAVICSPVSVNSPLTCHFFGFGTDLAYYEFHKTNDWNLFI